MFKYALSGTLVIHFLLFRSVQSIGQTCPVPILAGLETITDRFEKVIYPTTARVKIEWEIISGNAFTNFGITKNEQEVVSYGYSVAGGGLRSQMVNDAQGKKVEMIIFKPGNYGQPRDPGKTDMRFHYKIYEVGVSLMKERHLIEGNLFGQGKNTVYTYPSCNSKTKIIVRRKSGRAKGTISVYERFGSNWNSNPSMVRILEQSDDNQIFTLNSNKELKIEIKNNSVGNQLGYSINALVTN
ncbi:MAG: hypothetical protein KDC57_11060 [Saprospiraceae bacterium]|nr:hypothetical protein [Saprospiraceae bacterium]